MSSPGSISATFAPLVLNGQPVNGGFSFNYAIPDTSAIAKQSFNFLQGVSSNDFGFLNQTIGQTQSFVSGAGALAQQDYQNANTFATGAFNGAVTGANTVYGNATSGASGVLGSAISGGYGAISAAGQGGYSALNTTINNAGNWLAGLTNPVLGMANSMQKFNAGELPSMVSMENNLAQAQQANSYAIQLANINANQNVAIASINSSAQVGVANANASHSSGGGCFITTAVCEFEGLPDDCYTLTTLRWLRDGYVKSHHPDLVAEYYAIAPDLVSKLNAKKNRTILYETIRMAYIEPCLSLIESGENAIAVKHYEKMVQFVKAICDE